MVVLSWKEANWAEIGLGAGGGEGRYTIIVYPKYIVRFGPDNPCVFVAGDLCYFRRRK